MFVEEFGTVAEAFLEEQLKRVRDMTERVAQVRSQVIRNLDAIASEVDVVDHNPLNEIRDLRTYQTHEPQAKRFDPASESTPRRRRRR